MSDIVRPLRHLPGDDWPDTHPAHSLIRAARLHFPLNHCLHDGGTTRLRKWADVLRGLADTLDVLSRNQSLETHALGFASQAIHTANMKIGGYRHGRNSV